MKDLFRFSADRAKRHPSLVLVLYFATLAPALLWVVVLSSELFSGFSSRPLAENLFGPKGLATWLEFSGSPESNFNTILGLFPLVLLLSWLLQIWVSAGVVNVLVQKDPSQPYAFWLGVRRFGGRFFRSGLLFLVSFGLLLVPLMLALGKIGTVMAERNGSENWEMGSFALRVLLALALFIPMDLAYDLSRISAVAHDGRKMFRGFRSALGKVLRTRRYRVVYFLFAVAAVAVMAVYSLLSDFLAPSTAVGILVLVLLQQLSMVARSYIKLRLWAAEVGAFEDAGSPDWCLGGQPRQAGVPQPEWQPGESQFVS